MSNPFQYINNINDGIKDVTISSDYNQFLTNRTFSLHIDTVAIANEVNQYNIPDDIHFKYLSNAIQAKKRYSGKWPKPKIHDDVSILSKYYDINMSRAYDLFHVISDDILNEIKEELKELS